METYATLSGEVIILHDLTAEERMHLDICLYAFRKNMYYPAFVDLARGRGNPQIRATEGMVTREIWTHPLFRVTRDLEDRLGIQQDFMAAEPGDRLDDGFLTNGAHRERGAGTTAK